LPTDLELSAIPAGSDPGGLPVPVEQEFSDEIAVEQLSRRDRRSDVDVDGDSRVDAHGRAMESSAVVS
jgi:hypothetical protein